MGIYLVQIEALVEEQFPRLYREAQERWFSPSNVNLDSYMIVALGIGL